MNKMIPDNAFYTSEVRLNGTAIPGYSTWHGEIDIASLSCAENPSLPFHVSSVQALLDDVEGLSVTLQAKSHLVEPKPRHNIIQRVWLAITNHTAAPITFEDKRLVLFGRGAAVGFTLPRQPIPALAPTTGTPFEVLDLDGVVLDTAFVSVTNEGAGSGDMVKATYDPGNTGQAIPQLASEAEAEAASNNEKYVSPLRVRQAIVAYSSPLPLSDGSTVTIDSDLGQVFHLDEMAGNRDFVITGTPGDMARLAIRITADSTARLPSWETTGDNKVSFDLVPDPGYIPGDADRYMVFRYNLPKLQWDCVSAV